MATTTRYVGTCAACEGRIKVRGGTLVHHGYQRPGYGHIVGDCFGVHRLPHETSPDVAEAYRALLRTHLEELAAEKAHVEQATQLRYTYKEGALGNKRTVVVTVQKGDPARYEKRTSIPSFDSLQRQSLRQLEMRRDAIQREVERLTRLVDTWEARDLATVEEEASKGRAEAQAKRDEKRAARDRKKAEKAQRDAARAASAQAHAPNY